MLDAEDIATACVEPAVLADGLRLADHFHALGIGVRRSAVTAAVAWLLTGVAHELHDNPDLNPDGMDRPSIARWLLAIVEGQLDVIGQLDAAGIDGIEKMAVTREISAPAGIGSGGAAHA